LNSTTEKSSPEKCFGLNWSNTQKALIQRCKRGLKQKKPSMQGTKGFFVG
jgi:hypothetical protein